MKIVILGAGAIGTASAYYLAKAGHEVTVIERQLGRRWKPVSLTPVKSLPVTSAVGGPWVCLEGDQMVDDGAQPLAIRPSTDPAMALCFQMLMNCTTKRYEINKGPHAAYGAV